MPFELTYIGTSRFHRNRANLIQTLHTVAAFQRIGASVRLHLPPWKSGESVRERLKDFGVHLPIDIRPTTLLHSRWRRWRYRPFVQWHRRALRAADVIYTRAPQVSLALANAGLRHHLEIHDTRDLVEEGLLGGIVDAHRTGKIDWLVPISKAAADFLVRSGAASKRVHVGPSGADIDAYAEIARFDPRRLDHPCIVYVGRVSQTRGMHIFKAVAERGIAEVILVGEQEYGHEGCLALQVLPFVPHREIPQWYARADIVLLPYQRDLGHAESISPLKLFEALAAGRPIVASDIAPIRELLEHEKTALLVDPDDVDAWVNAVDRLRHDRDLAMRLAGAARTLAPRYSWRQRALDIARALDWPLSIPESDGSENPRVPQR